MRSRLLIISVIAVVAAACSAGGDSENTGGDDAVATTDGGDDGGTGSGDTTTTVPDAGDGGQATELPFDSGEGTIEVDGEAFDTQWVVSCILEEPGDENLEVIAYTGDLFLELDVTRTTTGPGGDRNYDAFYLSADLGRSVVEFEVEPPVITGPDGTWYADSSGIQLALGTPEGEALAVSPYERQGDRISGTLNMAGDGGTATVVYDLTVPSETFDCDQL